VICLKHFVLFVVASVIFDHFLYKKCFFSFSVTIEINGWSRQIDPGWGFQKMVDMLILDWFGISLGPILFLTCC